MSDTMLRRVAALMEAATRHGGVLGQASLYHLDTGGGMWRAKLAVACAGELGVADTRALALAAACELVHQASVVHDDVQDQAPLRRGQMSVAARFGAPVAICVGDHLLMAAFRTVAEASDGAALIRLFTSRVSDMAAGQAEEFSPALWSTMTRTGYVSLVEAKAGAMIALPVEAASMLGGLGAADIRRAGQFARAMGVAYQMTDDAADVAPDLVRGGLNGVLVQAVCSADPVRGKNLRLALTRAAEKGFATQDEATLVASLRPAAEATIRWRDQLLAEAMAELAGHPLRRILLDAATALAPSPQTPAMGSQHAA